MSATSDYARERFEDGEGRFTAFIDFAASPLDVSYILTWNARVCCEAVKAGKTAVDVVALTERDFSQSAFQPYMDDASAQRLFIELLPAFYTNPMLFNCIHLRDRDGFERRMHAAGLDGGAVFPGFEKYAQGVRGRQAIYHRHPVINAFYAERGHVPRLATPPAYRIFAEGFLKSYSPHALIVTIQARGNDGGGLLPGEAGDEGDFGVWEAFIDAAQDRHPETLFILLDSGSSWSRRLLRRSGVVIPRSLGLGLMEELALVQLSDLFMAPPVRYFPMAVFSSTPYLMFIGPDQAREMAERFDVQRGAASLPFAQPAQSLVWEAPEAAALLDAFEDALTSLRG